MSFTNKRKAEFLKGAREEVDSTDLTDLTQEIVSSKKKRLFASEIKPRPLKLSQAEYATITKQILNSGDRISLDVSDPEKVTINTELADIEADIASKQDLLMSGTNIRTINGNSVLGSGNLLLTKFNFPDLNNVENTPDLNKPISNPTRSLINTKQDILVSGSTLKSINGATLLGSGEVSIDKNFVGLSNIDNTSDENKPLSLSAVQALNLKQNVLVSGTNVKTLNNSSILGSGNVVLDKNFIGLANIDNTSDIQKPLSTATMSALDLKQNLLISGSTISTINNQSLMTSGNINITKTTMGLSNVNNTSDSNKPVSIAAQAALDLKQNVLTAGSNIKTLNNVSVLGSGNLVLDKSFVNLMYVDNTSDLNKPISTATQSALTGLEVVLDAKQDTLVPGSNIKTINGASILGAGNVELTASSLNLDQVDNTSDLNKPISTATQAALNLLDAEIDTKQATLLSGQNISTINGQSLLTGTDLEISRPSLNIDNVDNTADLDKPISTATQQALDLKQSSLVNGNNIKSLNNISVLGSGNLTIDKVFVDLANIDNTSDLNKPISVAAQNVFDAKQDLLVAGDNLQTLNSVSILGAGNLVVDKNFVLLDQVDNTADANKPVSIAAQTALDQKQNLLQPGVNIKTLNSSSVLGSGDFLINKITVGLDQVDNTSDWDKPISIATAQALDLKQDDLVDGVNIKTLNGNSLLGSGNINFDKAALGLDEVDNTSDYDKPVSQATATALALKQDVLVSALSIKTVNGVSLLDQGDMIVDKEFVGLPNVDNTADSDKPISLLQQAALDAKQDELISGQTIKSINNISLLGQGNLVFEVDRDLLGINNVDNTSDLNKPVSTAQQAALDLKQSLAEKNQPDGYAGLDANSKILLSQMPITGLFYKGTWNADTNTPTINTNSGTTGDYYKVSVQGSTAINGITDWDIGDWIIYSGTEWQKVDNSELVSSVAGKIGNVSLVKGDVGLGNVDNTADASKPISTAAQTALDLKQNVLSSGTSIKTVNNVSLLGSGNVPVQDVLVSG